MQLVEDSHGDFKQRSINYSSSVSLKSKELADDTVNSLRQCSDSGAGTV
jgi:hypothetical protein